MAAKRKASGNWNPDWEPFAALDGAWTDKFLALAMAPTVSSALDPVMLEIVGVAMAAVGARPDRVALRRHIRRALEAGATREQITAVLQLASLQGIRSLCIGAPILLEELAAAPQKPDKPKEKK
jgi:alkylhydroperoxidase/carboxymuconolactone decarboxylase family protein YurZ